MGVGFGGSAIYNRASPSSHDRCVARIVRDYMTPVTARPIRILDIGGTAQGFRAHAALPAGCQVIVANPEASAEADCRYVSDIPLTAERFDFAMLFGVMMYLERAPLVSLMRDVRQRLRGQGTLLIAEPNPEGVLGQVEIAAKRVYAAIVSLWDPTRFTFYSIADTTGMAREAGFSQVRERADLTPNAMGVFPPPMPPYFVMAVSG